MKIDKFLSGIAFFCLTAALLLTVIDRCCFDKGFYTREYTKCDTAASIEMSQEDLTASTDALLDYLQGRRDDIVVDVTVSGYEQEVFNQRETLHMKDVKVLYQKAILVRNILAAAGAAILAGLLILRRKKGHRWSMLTTGYKAGACIIGALILFIAVWALSDFDAFWTSFHELFFDNDLWLLDPNTSIMINMFPDTFFFDLVLRIIVWFVGIMAVSGILIYQPWRIKKAVSND
ncbi:MAG: TIGR01906 family membrane protein [Solobacterium sp.]|jgi:integral membrane protein (TIGR01906 family)|nr:TIGR01906 family membrane protein [Solobacterium sp.]